ncbi:MAG: PspC domain-containing protein [Burkholderiaceae bacterium]|jgi:phage shock protein PspC (stress-responsive transcriptional regulator)|nr:PspC domain-containing protein [Burkholderiaceae bacterium]
MNLADELAKLQELHARGALSDDEFARAKAKLLDTRPSSPPPPPSVAAINTLRRNRTDKWLGGVCGGLGLATGVDSWIWRLLFVVLALFGGTGVVIYLLLWIFVPLED